MMTFAEIGAKLHISAGTVYGTYRRALRKLRARGGSTAAMRDAATALERDRDLRLKGTADDPPTNRR